MSEFSTPVTQRSGSRLCEDSAMSPFHASPFMIPPSPFMTRLGYGTGVSVYRFKRETNENDMRSPWAVKKVNKKARSGISERLALEASILKQLQHPNIVGFRAISGSVDGELCLAMEDCEKALETLIEEKAFLEEEFTYEEVLKVAWDIANALSYIHNEKKLLHGDLKSGNVLIRGNFDAVKLCDFGVAIRLKDDLSGLKNPKDRYIGTEPWKCKEALNSGVITDKADIFAYGLLIWEMLALNVPHVDLLAASDDEGDTGMTSEDEEDAGACDTEEYLAALGTRPPLPAKYQSADWMTSPVIQLFCCCTSEDPKERPSAKDIVAALKPEVMAKNVQI
ncbi:hypothetical protein ACROYT_G044107 [Oculina patagonica]